MKMSTLFIIILTLGSIIFCFGGCCLLPVFFFSSVQETVQKEEQKQKDDIRQKELLEKAKYDALSPEEKIAYDLVQIKKAEAEEKAKKVLARKRKINSYFSAWDGSCRLLVRELKSNLINPKSFEHIITKYYDEGEYLSIMMRYKIGNAFGGLRLETANARLYLKNDIVIIYTTDPKEPRK